MLIPTLVMVGNQIANWGPISPINYTGYFGLLVKQGCCKSLIIVNNYGTWHLCIRAGSASNANGALPVEIPFERLEAETLRQVVEEFISREGTDYGERTYTLEEKIAQITNLLRIRKAVLVFDPTTESVNIVSR